MKNALVIGILCLGIGFGAGWLVKPDSTPETATNSPAKAPAKSAIAKAPSAMGGGSGAPSKANSKMLKSRKVVINGQDVDGDDSIASEDGERMQNRWQEMMDKRRQAKQDAQIQKLVDRLGLNPDQVAKLREYLKKNDVNMAALMEGGGAGDWSKIKDLTQNLGGEGMEEALAGVLTDEQKVAYEEMKQRDLANKIEAKAYKDLAKIQGILDLSQDQKDQVYNLLHENAGANIDQNKEANAMLSVFSAGSGVEFDANDLGLGSAVQAQIEAAEKGEEVDANAWMRTMQENRARQIEEKVALLAPVLDDQQEAAYRTHLETQGGGIFDEMLMGIDGADVEVESVVIPSPEAE